MYHRASAERRRIPHLIARDLCASRTEHLPVLGLFGRHPYPLALAGRACLGIIRLISLSFVFPSNKSMFVTSNVAYYRKHCFPTLLKSVITSSECCADIPGALQCARNGEEGVQAEWAVRVGSSCGSHRCPGSSRTVNPSEQEGILQL
ncbi:hypothetical protein M758_UG123900 [Ceratodon purpureus]|nr:hypothetical protein M758_UG123900 [Ceratodon purpureus]